MCVHRERITIAILADDEERVADRLQSAALAWKLCNPDAGSVRRVALADVDAPGRLLGDHAGGLLEVVDQLLRRVPSHGAGLLGSDHHDLRLAINDNLEFGMCSDRAS